MTTRRLEAFADGVFAIAATLLILNVDAQVRGGEQDLGRRLLHVWPSYAAYAISFLTIGIIWVNHHAVMHQLAGADRTFLFLNVGFLMCVAFIPFPTRLVAEHIREAGYESPMTGAAPRFAFGRRRAPSIQASATSSRRRSRKRTIRIDVLQTELRPNNRGPPHP
jgi:hypothetical protein